MFVKNIFFKKIEQNKIFKEDSLKNITKIYANFDQNLKNTPFLYTVIRTLLKIHLLLSYIYILITKFFEF